MSDIIGEVVINATARTLFEALSKVPPKKMTPELVRAGTELYRELLGGSQEKLVQELKQRVEQLETMFRNELKIREAEGMMWSEGAK